MLPSSVIDGYGVEQTDGFHKWIADKNECRSRDMKSVALALFRAGRLDRAFPGLWFLTSRKLGVSLRTFATTSIPNHSTLDIHMGMGQAASDFFFHRRRLIRRLASQSVELGRRCQRLPQHSVDRTLEVLVSRRRHEQFNVRALTRCGRELRTTPGTTEHVRMHAHMPCLQHIQICE